MRFWILILALVAFPLLGAVGPCSVPVEAPSVTPSGPVATGPYLGCDQPWATKPGPDEGGDVYVRVFNYSPDDRVDAVEIDIRNWYRDDAGQVQMIADAELLPFEVYLWLGTNPSPPSSKQVYSITPSAWGLLSIPLRNSFTGPISVGIQMVRGPIPTGADRGNTVPLGMCKSRTLSPGREFWCKGTTCTDMALGGDSPQPGYVAYPAGIWTVGVGPNHPEGAPPLYGFGSEWGPGLE